MIDKADFLKKGGVLDSSITHSNADVLASGTHERRVEGVGEELAQKLHLGVRLSSLTSRSVSQSITEHAPNHQHD